jgi:YjbR protein
MLDPADAWYRKVQTLALSLPGAQEKLSHGRPAFFTKKVFAYYGGSHKVDGVWVQHPQSVVLLADLDGQLALRAEDGAYVPGYLGPYGWTGLDLDERTDTEALADGIRASYEFTAPRQLVRDLDRQTPFRTVLSGGNPRTLVGVEDVLAELRGRPSRLPELLDCCSETDPVVRMRAADALEKFARQRPDLVALHVDRLHTELAASPQPSLQWHLAQIWGEVPLSAAQQHRATEWLTRTLDEAEDWIVLTNAMSALAALADTDPSLRPALRERLRRHATSRLPSVAKRANRLLERLADRGSALDRSWAHEDAPG